MGRFSAQNGRIGGRGKRTLVLSHGFGTDRTAWSALLPWAEAHFRVVSYDLAGAGPEGAASYDPRRHGTLYGYADDLIEILEETESQDCLYVGHSVSGMIGTAAAVSRPDLFDRLVMIGAAARYLNDGAYHGGFEQSDLDGVYAGMAANYQAWGAGFAPIVVGSADDPAVDEFCRTLTVMRPDIALAMLRTIFQSDMRPVVSRLDKPVVLIQTQKDHAVPLAAAQWLEAHLPHSVLHVIDATGHLPHMTAPDKVQAVLGRELLSLAGG